MSDTDSAQPDARSVDPARRIVELIEADDESAALVFARSLHPAEQADALSGIEKEVIELIEKKLGQVDLILYSLAAPRRQDPATGQIYSSVIKPVGGPYTTKTVDFKLGIVSKQTLPEANAEEIDQTVRVMGGEDWRLWIQACRQAGILAPGSRTVAFSYIGPAVTYPIYREGTIGRAKENLEATAKELDKDLSPDGGSAVVSVNKAVVTRASSVIPAVPLYLSLLYRVMKDRDLHETCLQQMRRLFKDYLAPGVSGPLDGEGRIRLDDRELSAEVQDEVSRLWEEVRTENLEQISDIEGFKKDFYRLHGFAVEGVDYEKEVSL